MTGKTIFEQIRDRELPAEIIFEDEDFIAFPDLHPRAPVHILIVPKIAHPTLEAMDLDDLLQLRLLQTARRLARQLKIDQNYQLHLNVGRQVQQVHHVHLHLLGGWQKPNPEI